MKKIIFAIILNFLILPQSFGATAQVNSVSNIVGFAANSSACSTIPAGDATHFWIKSGKAAGSGEYYRFYRDGALYQVTTGTAFRAECVCKVANASMNYQYVYSLTTWTANTLPANCLTQSGMGCGNVLHDVSSSTVTCASAVGTSFPSLSYPGTYQSGTGNYEISLWGSEL